MHFQRSRAAVERPLLAADSTVEYAAVSYSNVLRRISGWSAIRIPGIASESPSEL